MVSRTVDILARFLPRSGESREDGLSAGDSGLSGPGIVEDSLVVTREGLLSASRCAMAERKDPVCGV